MSADLNAYHKGPVSNFSFRRDPLSVRFDASADKLVTRAIEARGAWVTAWVPSPEAERDELDDGGLTHHERAFLAACYHHRLIYMWGSGRVDGHRVRNPERRYSLKREWGPLQARGRVLRVRVIRTGEASLYAKDQGWTG